MKKTIVLTWVGLCLIPAMLSLGNSQWDVGTPIKKGYRINNSVVNVTSTTASTIISANAFRVDVIIYNTSTANSLYVSSYTALTGDANTDTGGFEIPKQTWFSLDGKFTGVIYGKGPAGASGTTNVVTILECIGN